MSLITKSEINSIAYISAVPESRFKDAIITMVETFHIQSALGATLYTNVVNTPASYSTLLDSFIKPCIAFYCQMYERDAQLIEYVFSVDSLLLTALQNQIEYARQMALSFKTNLKDYVFSNYNVQRSFVAGISVNAPDSTAVVSEFTLSVTDWEKEKGVRLTKDSGSWGVETYDSSSDTWIREDFSEPLS